MRVQFIMGFTIPANVFCYMQDVHCMGIVKLRIHSNYTVLTETPFKNAYITLYYNQPIKIKN